MSKRIEDLRRFRPAVGFSGRAEMHLDTSGDWVCLQNFPQPRDTRKDPPPNGFYFGQWVGVLGVNRETNIAWVVNGEWYAINEEGIPRRRDPPDYWCEMLTWGHLGKKP